MHFIKENNYEMIIETEEFLQIFVVVFYESIFLKRDFKDKYVY